MDPNDYLKLTRLKRQNKKIKKLKKMENKKILIITPTHNIIWTLLHVTMIMANFNTSLIRRDTFFIMLDEDSNILIVKFCNLYHS